MPTWIITGANRGLGLEFVSQLSADPTNTIISTVRSLSRPHQALQALTSSQGQGKPNPKLHILECDTGSTASISQFGDAVSALLANDAKIDFLLNNAGINAVPQQDSLSMTGEDVAEHMRVNVMGPATMVQVCAAKGLLGTGSVVMNMSSGLGSLAYHRASGGASCTVYSLSKAGVNMLTVHQASGLKEKGVIVICMDPG